MTLGLLPALACTTPESAPVLPGTLAPPCALVTQAYAVTDVTLPRSSSETAQSFDLDEDGRPDGLSVAIWADAIAIFGLPLVDTWEGAMRTAFADGRARWVVVTETCADAASDHARVSLQRATDLDGDGKLELAHDGEVPAVGSRAGDDTIEAVQGIGSAPLLTLFDPLGVSADAGWAYGQGLHVRLEAEQDGQRALRIGIALEGRLDPVAVPLAALFTAEAERVPFAADVDTDLDGTVSASELLEDRLVSAIMVPDVDVLAIDGGAEVFYPSHDGVNDACSLFVRGSATRVELE